jgi:hypothetical protein
MISLTYTEPIEHTVEVRRKRNETPEQAVERVARRFSGGESVKALTDGRVAAGIGCPRIVGRWEEVES